MAVFDASHGQRNWVQTGFTSREMHTNFAGLMETLCHRDFHCHAFREGSLDLQLANTRLLVIPPPTGHYDIRHERWLTDRSALFTSQEVRTILSFLQNGGRLLAFAYRFGDSFTKSNLQDLFGPLGCQLNDDAVIDASALGRTHPLEMHFDTPAQSLPLSWSRAGVTSVRWRPSATFNVLPGATVCPLVLSTGGRCLSFDCKLRRICFQPLPIAVAGRHGLGRFAFFGGPHAFETSPLGLLAHAGNARFLRNVLDWLLSDQPQHSLLPKQSAQSIPNIDTAELTCVEAWGDGERTIASVEKVLRKTGILKALNRAKWMP